MEIFKKTLIGVLGVKINNTRALGIDMGASAIKFAEVSSSGNDFCVDAYHVVPVPDGSTSMGNIVDHMAVTDAVKSGLSSHKFRATGNVSLVLPDSMVTIREMLVSSNLSSKDIEDRAQQEAAQVSGTDISELAVDFCEDKRHSDSTQKRFIVAIAKQEQVDDRVQLVKEAGIMPRILDVELYAFHTMCSRFLNLNPSLNSDGKINLFIEFGHSKILFLFMRGREVVFTKEQSFGVIALNHEVQSELDIDFSGADRIITGKDEAPDKYLARVLPEFISEFTAVVSRTLQLFYTTTSFIKIDGIFMSGGGEKLKNLLSILEEEVGIPVKQLVAFSDNGISSSINKDYFFSDLPVLTTAIGIAIRNLLNDPI